MSIRAILLCAAAALVALGGIYLLVQVKASGAEAPSDKAIAEASSHHARTAPPSATRPHRDDGGATATPTIPKPNRPGFLGGKTAFAAVPDVGAVNAAAEPDSTDKPEEAEAFESQMTEANKLYDRQQFDESRQLALKLLEKKPGTVRMMRVVVSSSCILGDAETAQKYWTDLPEFDQNQMATRCERFDIKFK